MPWFQRCEFCNRMILYTVAGDGGPLTLCSSCAGDPLKVHVTLVNRPGAEYARVNGCTCNAEENHHGRGLAGDYNANGFAIDESCELHAELRKLLGSQGSP